MPGPNSRQRRRRRVIRERNERGFLLFLRSLETVLRVFVTCDDSLSSLTHDDIAEIKERLLDSLATLNLLKDDTEKGESHLQSITGVAGPAESILDHLNNICTCVTHLVYLLTDLLESHNADGSGLSSVNEGSVSYAAPVSQSDQQYSGIGRRKKEITRDQLEHLRSLHFSWTKIADILHVGISTIQRRRQEFGLDAKFENFSNISDSELDNIYVTLTSQTGQCFITPNLGRRRFLGALRSRGLRIQRHRVSACIRRVDPIGTALRWRLVINRRKYFVPTPNSLWHIDSAHKLIRWKLIVHVCIDGKTRLIIYCVCCDNNKAESVLSLFQDGVARWGLPSRVRCDYGMENYLVGSFMIDNRGANRGSIITGSSVHNSRVERTHRDVYCGVLVFYARLFENMEADGILDPLDEVHLFSLHHIYIPRINKSLSEFVAQMNNHPISTERNCSPLQLWEQGMLENMYLGHTAVEPTELHNYGIDPDDVPSVPEEDYQVSVEPPQVALSPEQFSFLPDPLNDDGSSGKQLYLECVSVISQHANATF